MVLWDHLHQLTELILIQQSVQGESGADYLTCNIK
jgi:hypothetical protein